MKNDFIMSESEISSAVTALYQQAEFLEQSIDRYIKILSNIQNGGIRDKLICSELSNLAELATKNQDRIAQVYENLATYMNSEFNEAEGEDNFKFPSDFMTEVTSILSRFF